MGTAAVAQSSDTSKILASQMAPGWECLGAPNSLLHPGKIYRKDAKGRTFPVADLGDKVAAYTGNVAPLVVNDNEKISAGFLIQFLNLFGVKASGSKTYAVAITLLDRTETDTDDDPVKTAIRAAVTPQSQLAGWDYYIVRATQQAKRVQMTVDRAIATDLGGDYAFQKAVSVKGAAAPLPPTAAPPADKPASEPQATSDSAAAPASAPASATSKTPDAASKPNWSFTLNASGFSGSFGAGAKPALASAGAAKSTKPRASTASKAQGGDQSTPSIFVSSDDKTYTIDTGPMQTALTVCYLSEKFNTSTILGGVGSSATRVQLLQQFDAPHASK